jgi:hypothetical protein
MIEHPRPQPKPTQQLVVQKTQKATNRRTPEQSKAQQKTLTRTSKAEQKHKTGNQGSALLCSAQVLSFHEFEMCFGFSALVCSALLCPCSDFKLMSRFYEFSALVCSALVCSVRVFSV